MRKRMTHTQPRSLEELPLEVPLAELPQPLGECTLEECSHAPPLATESPSRLRSTPPRRRQVTVIRAERSVEHRLAHAERPGELWLWCLHCSRFFQARDLRVDYLGSRQGCPFCDAAGLDIDIFYWNEFRRPGDPAWPACERELQRGMTSRR